MYTDTRDSDRAGSIPESDESFERFLQTPGWIHVIGMVQPPRPGVNECMVRLEHTYFPPGTELNNEFQLRIMKWGGEILWMIASIPKGKKPLLEAVAAQCGLRLARGTPTLFTGDGASSFPAQGPHVYTLENTEGHPVYKNRDDIKRALREQELTSVRSVLDKDR